METRSFIIIASNKSNVEVQIEKLNKRARKLGLDELIYSWGKAYLETREVPRQDPEYPDMAPVYVKQEVLVIPIEITGPLDVSYEGWRFIATLQHLPTGENIIRSISNEFEIPKQYRTAGSDCHHCYTKRYRKDTYLVRDDTTGAVIQVGSTCIKDFLGGNSPDNILNKANIIAELLSYMEGCSGNYGSGGDDLCYIEDFLAMTSACIRDHGWVSKKAAYENGGMATATWVDRNLDPPIGFKDRSLVTDGDKELAKAAMEWAENITDAECDTSDYLYNIRAIARSGMVGYRTFGFAASIIPAHNRANADKNQKVESQHVGTLKKRQIFELTLNQHFSYDSHYGTVHKYIFADKDGNKLVWATSKITPMIEGKHYAIKGTVKAHSEYKNSKQTEITRCEILTTYPSDTTEEIFCN